MKLKKKKLKLKIKMLEQMINKIFFKLNKNKNKIKL